jgi:hypothetical protein
MPSFDIKIKPAEGPQGMPSEMDPMVPPEEQKPTQATVELKIRKTLDGSFVIFDHPEIDVVIMPQMLKVVSFPKGEMGDHIYATQSRLFEFLSKKGVVVFDSVQSGNLYGSLEANIPPPANPEIDPIEVAIYVTSKFIEEEKPFYDREEKYQDDVEEWMTEPEDEHSTDLDWAEKTHQPRKGVQNRWPGSTAAYGLTGMYRA